MRKQKGKTGDSIDEKPPKLNKETRRKTGLEVWNYLQRMKNLQNLN